MASGSSPSSLAFPGRYVGPNDGSFPGRYPDTASFDPNSLSGLIFWADGSVVGGADGAAIGTFPNLSSVGSANNATQGTAGQKPLLKLSTNGIHGLGVLRFDGVDDMMLCPADLHGASTLCLVYRLRVLPGASTVYTITSFKSPSGGGLFDELLLCNSAGYQPFSFRTDYLATGNAVGIADALDLNPHVLILSYNAGGSSTPASYTSVLDGVTKTCIASGAFARNAPDLGSIGARSNSAGTSALPFNGDIGEILRFNRQLSGAEQLSLNNWLRPKWSI